MKKLIILIVCFTLLCGCTKINNDNINNIINSVVSSDNDRANQYRNGYKFYLPNNLSTIKIDDKNNVFKENYIKYYMFVDIVSYYHKVENKYQVNEKAYYSSLINYNNKSGYVEVNVKNDKYLIEIMYNYAKIEVMVDKDMINETIANSLIILSSIKYNDDIINNLMGKNILNYREETFTIFDKEKNDSDFLEVIQEYDKYNEPKIPDYDLIN